MGRVKRFLAGVLFCAMATTWACERKSPPAAPPAATTNLGPPAGTVGPLADDCYSTAAAVACPPDPGDPSGRNLPTLGGACALNVCRPCGSATKLAFRDEHGIATAGFCVCVPKSDDSGKGSFTCYSNEAWKNRQGTK